MIESSYTKLFSSIVTSTIWREDDKTRIVWITMLALKNRHGQVAGSVPGLAAMANVSTEDCRAALVRLSEPDPDSRSKEFDGRRIEAMDGGWQVLNHGKYRDAMSKDERAAYQAAWQKKYRQKKKEEKTSVTVDGSVDSRGQELTHADTDADAVSVSPPSGDGGRKGKVRSIKGPTDYQLYWITIRQADASSGSVKDKLMKQAAEFAARMGIDTSKPQPKSPPSYHGANGTVTAEELLEGAQYLVSIGKEDLLTDSQRIALKPNPTP